jgi:hypothetical protein
LGPGMVRRSTSAIGHWETAAADNLDGGRFEFEI